MRRFPLAAALALVLAGGVLAARAEEAADREREMAACQSLVADRDFGAAEKALEAFAKKWKRGEAVEEAALLLGRARLLAGRPDEALATLRALVDAAPAGAWSEKARWVMADACAAKRDWKGAADILQARTGALASPEHRRAVAGYYLEVADEAWTGKEATDDLGRKSVVRDFPRALDFYRRARAVELAPADVARVAHRIARSALESGDPAAAAAEWTALLERGTPGDLAAEATFGLGQALAAAGDLPGARKRFREAAAKWADSEFAPRALVALGDSFAPMTTKDRGDLDRGLDAWREFRRLYSGHPDGPAVAYRVGLALASFGDRALAVKEWAELLAKWPDHEVSPQAVHGTALAKLGLEEFDGAVAAWKDLLARWPNHPLWSEARRMLPKVSFARAEVEMREKRWDGAVAAFRRFLEEFPGEGEDDAGRPVADRRRAQGQGGPGRRAGGVAPRPAEVARGALGPGGLREGGRVPRRRGGGSPRGHPRVRGPRRPLARHPPGPGGAARPRRDEGEAPRGLPRPADHHGPPAAHRLPPAQRGPPPHEGLPRGPRGVRAGQGLAGGGGGGRHGRREARRRVGLAAGEPRAVPPPREEVRGPGPGAGGVDRARPGRGALGDDPRRLLRPRGDREARPQPDPRPRPGRTHRRPRGGGAGRPPRRARRRHRGRRRVDRRGERRARARVEGRIPRLRPRRRGGGDDLRLHAQGLPVPRPAPLPPRPGRRAQGLRAPRRGRGLRLPRGRQGRGPRRGPARDDDPPRRAPHGPLRRVRGKGHGPRGGGAGHLARHRALHGPLLPLDLRGPRVPPPRAGDRDRGARACWLAGEEVKATVSVRYGAGGVVRGAPVRWRVGRQGFSFDGTDLASYASWFRDPAREAERAKRTAAEGDLVEVASGEGTADDKGVLALAFPTEAGDRDWRYVLEVMVRDGGGQWVRDAEAFPVTSRGFYAVARSERRVWKPGEEMTLEIFTVDANQAPVAAEGRAILARRRAMEGGRVAEEEVASVPAATGKDGRAVVKLKADRPGEYALVFAAKDAGGRPVEGRAAVTVAGEAEDLAKDLRLVCDRETYREGDEAAVLLNVPAAPCTVLLTFEGERVLEHRVVRATERSTTVPCTLRPLFAPNVFVRAALLKDGKLLEAGDEVLVFRFLNVEVVPEKAEARPGEKVGVLVRTTDQRGNPVSAGVAVSAVDRAILQLQPDRTPDPRPFFYDQRRGLGVSTTSTVAFLPGGATRPTNKDLLFEEARRLGRAGYERLQKHVREGKAALEQGNLEAAKAEFEKALELSPGNYEARVLLSRAVADVHALEERAAFAAEPALGDALSRDEMRKVAEKAEGKEWADKKSGGPPAAKPRRAPGSPAPSKSLKDSAEGGETADEEAEANDGGGIGVGGGGGGAFGGRRGGRKNLQLRGGGAGGILPPLDVPASLRERFLDSALWAPAVATGADGTARVEIDLPDNLTTWRLTARGASVDTLVGEGRGGLSVRLPVLVRTSAPRFLGARDEATVETVVHNDTAGPVDAAVSLAGTGVAVKGATETRATLAAGEVRAFPWSLAAGPAGLATLEAKVMSPVASDARKSALPILPHGIPWVRAASGALRDSAVAALDLPADAQAGTARLRVSFSPSLDAILLRAVEWNGAFPYGCVEQTVGRFLPALAAEDALKRASVPDAALRARLRDSVERGLLALYALQNDDGSFGWASRGGAADPQMTAHAVGGMLRAERAGYALSPKNRALGIQAAQALARSADPEARAHLLHALAFGGAADAGDLNALFRNRDSLSDRGLARLSLAMALTGRRDRAADGVALLRARARTENDLLHWDDGSDLCRRRGIPVEDGGEKVGFAFAADAEPTALALQAFLAVAPDDPVVEPAVRWILARRRGPCWRSTKDTAAVVDALGAVMVRRGVERQEFTAKVFVNDGAEPAATFTARAADGGPSKDLEIPAAGLRAGRNTVRLEKSGGGEVHFAAVLSAFRDGEDVPAEGNLLKVDRRWTRWFPRREGPVPEDADPVPGWSCADPSARPADESLPSLARVGSGDLFRATLVVEAREGVDYVLLEDPIPAGCEVVEGREEGPFDRFERRDDRAVFFLSKVPAGRVVVSYVLQGVHPGAYHALPAEASGMYEPEVRGRSAEGRLVVAPEAGVAARRGDAESITPDEVLGAARRALRREKWEEARDGFRALLKQWKLLPAVEVEAWAGIRAASLRLGDDRGIVESHEALLERDPRRVPADPRDALAVARAYNALGEHERAASLFRNLADVFFAEERAVADGYAAIGASMRSAAFRAEALLRYPDGSTTDAEEMALCRALRETRRTADGKGPAGLLLPEAAERLRMLLAHRPLLDSADEADMLLVDTLRRMELPGDALAEGERFLGRYPGSRWLDDVTWFLAAAAFDKGDWDRALAMAAPLVEKAFPRDDDPRRTDASPLRPQAWHLRGKVAHLRGNLAEAVRWYDLARQAVPDAADAFAFLTAASLEVPDLATFAPGAEPELKVRRRNIASLEARVYPVDFMILYAVRKDLSAVNRIDLTGIVPAARVERAWKDAGDRLWHEETLRLPVKEKGVYLVNVRGDAAASCIVIVSELRLEVQQAGPRLRVYATLARTGEPAPEVYVKVADGGTIKAQGFTDARGVFEAGEVGGAFSVVAEKDGSYALYRR